MTRALLLLLWLGIFAALAAVAGSFAGVVHPLGDSLAVFRLYFTGACLILAFLIALIPRKGRWLALGLGVISGVAALPVALSYGADDGAGGPHAIYQKNLLFRLVDPGPIVADILASDADLVTLQEVNGRNMAVMAALEQAYPAQAHCAFGTVGGTAVLSRWPAMGAPICSERGGLTALQVAAPDGPLWVVSVHLHWPYPYGQAAHVARLLPVIDGLSSPVIIGGDFNMVPWAHSVRTIARASRTRTMQRTATTLSLKGGLMPLPIDHVLVPTGWAATYTIRPELGSDHRGVLASFGP